MNTDARRKASAAFHAKREAAGYRKVTVWMHPDTRAELERLTKVYGSKEAAVAKAINHHLADADTLRGSVTGPGMTYAAALRSIAV